MDIVGGFIGLGLVIAFALFFLIFGGVEKPRKNTSISHQLKRK